LNAGSVRPFRVKRADSINVSVTILGVFIELFVKHVRTVLKSGVCCRGGAVVPAGSISGVIACEIC
jgi:hypothetical protein